MRWSSTLGCVVLLGLALATPSLGQRPNSLSFEEGEQGWMLLFDGRSLADFTVSGEADWRVVEGEIVAESGGISLLLTLDEYSDFELQVDFLADPGTNSGIFLRTGERPSDVSKDCYELNIAPPDNPFPTGSLVGRKKVEGAGELDDWRTYQVEAIGGRIKVRLDHELVLDYEDPSPVAQGFIGLQHNQGRVAFRNLKVRRLDW